MGRLLISFLLCHRGVLRKPLLYLSHYLKQHRQEYYDRLQAVRMTGDWESWLKFFLRGVVQVAAEAHQTAGKILSLRESHRLQLAQEGKASGNMHRALDLLFEHPLVTPNMLASRLEVSFPTANTCIARMVELGLLVEQTGQRRNRRFAYEPYLMLFAHAENQDFPG